MAAPPRQLAAQLWQRRRSPRRERDDCTKPQGRLNEGARRSRLPLRHYERASYSGAHLDLLAVGAVRMCRAKEVVVSSCRDDRPVQVGVVLIATTHYEAANLLAAALRAWMVEGDEMGGFGGGSLEHPRQWLGSQWAGLFLEVPSYPPPGAPRGGSGAELGRCQGSTLTMLTSICSTLSHPRQGTHCA